MVHWASPTPSPLLLHHGRREVHDAFAAAGAAGDEDAATWVFDVHKVPPLAWCSCYATSRADARRRQAARRSVRRTAAGHDAQTLDIVGRPGYYDDNANHQYGKDALLEDDYTPN